MILVIAFATLLAGVGPPTAPPADVEQHVRHADDAFWHAFNSCDRTRMAEKLAADVEFYHDKTGATTTRNAVVASLMDGPCGTAGLHVRREAVAGSLSFDAIPGFGAILTGYHRFYARRDGQPEHLDGEARFAIVWQIDGDQILMRRVLSYGHGPGPELAAADQVFVPATVLQTYVGRYTSLVGDIVVTMSGNRLHLVSGGLSTDLIALGAHRFKAKERAVQFAFTTFDKDQRILVHEDGMVVAEGIRQSAP